MPPKIVQDVIPPNKRSIRRIPIPPKKRFNGSGEGRQAVKEESYSSSPLNENAGGGNNFGGNHSNKKGKGWFRNDRFNYKIWAVAGISLVLLFFIFSAVVSEADIVIIPKSQTVSVDTSLTALKNSPGAGLRYDVIRITKEESKTVEAGEEEMMSVKASGKIKIFNNHSQEPQPLVATTRFETPEGLIYRIQEDVVVPGMNENNEGEMVPGSLEVTVYADLPGEEYNIELTDFTIPGFQGNPKFEDFYARSVTEMTGGFEGMAKKVADEELASVESELESELRSRLENDIFSQVPDNFILYSQGMFLSFEDMPQSESSGNTVTINKKGVLHAVLLDKDSLNVELVEEILSEQDEELPPAKIQNLGDLEFEISDSFNPSESESLDFTLRGEAKLVWLFDDDKLKEDLAGNHKSSLESVLMNYQSIQSADMSLRPFWKRSFPRNIGKINIEVVVE